MLGSDEIIYKDHTIEIGSDPYADDPQLPYFSYVYKDDEMLDGGTGFESYDEALSMAKSTIDNY